MGNMHILIPEKGLGAGRRKGGARRMGRLVIENTVEPEETSSKGASGNGDS